VLSELVSLKGPGHGVTLTQARMRAAQHLQFDVLLALTKPVFPLLTLLATGQVYNGLFFVMFTSSMLRKIPMVGPEALHLLCAMCGTLHCVLGVSANTISSHQADKGLLVLAWSWSFRDVAAIANIALLGATYASLGRLGNEPSFCASFASGVALFLLAADSGPSGWWAELNRRLTPLGVQFAPVGEIAVRARGGVGSCAGGLFRWFAGDRYSGVLVLVTKVFLMLLPLMATGQWVVRATTLARRAHRPSPRRRAIGSTVLASLGLVQCCLLLTFHLNAINGPLANFWIACLLGVVWESLLSTYDVLGRMRAGLTWVLYILL